MANIIGKYCLLCKHADIKTTTKTLFSPKYLLPYYLGTFSSSCELCHNIKSMAWAFVSLWVDPSPYIYWAFIKSMFFVQPIWCTMHWFPCGHMRHVINCDICCPMWQTPLESILSCDKRYKQVFQYNPQPGQRLIWATNISETLLIYGDFGCKSWIPTSLSNTEMRFYQKPSTVILLPIPGGDVSMSRIIHLHKWCDCWSGSPTYIHVSQGTWQVIHIHERPELFIPYFGDGRSYQIRKDLIVIVLI